MLQKNHELKYIHNDNISCFFIGLEENFKNQ